MEKVLSVLFCGGWRFSSREKELEVIRGALKRGDSDIEVKFDFSDAKFDFVHDDENNAVLREYEGDGGKKEYWNLLDYRVRSHLRANGGVVFRTSKGTFGFENFKLMKF